MTSFSEDCSSNQKRAQQDYKEKTSHRNAMNILKLLFND
jgi:hypothetical protein